MNAHHDHCARGTAAHARTNRNRLGIALCLAAAYMVAEALGGWLTNSLALLADAGHMFSDAAALGLSLFAAVMAARPATRQQTFGYLRAEILAALVNGAALLAVAAVILFEAWQRLWDPPQVRSGLMLAIAVGGLCVNLAALSVLHGGRHESVNLRGAWLHVLSDTLGSLGVIIAAACLAAFGWLWIDPAASILLSLLIVHASWALLRETVGILMESAPRTISVEDVRACLLAAPGVRDVHCLHVWTITSGLDSLSAHVVVDDDRLGADQLQRLRNVLASRFAVAHVTLQLEPSGFGACVDQRMEGCSAADPASPCAQPPASR
jgi:cobalt-zinc-cadmium efflux system protein